MIDYFDPEKLEEFLLEQIRRKSEIPKLDFKVNLQWSKKDQRERMNILKDINAIANTFEREFNDWGFIIFGVNRDDGKVSGEVDAFKLLGVDKLEAQIGQLVQSYMKPAPRFRVFQFMQNDLAIWGALVIEPGQPGPIVFSKKGTITENGNASELWEVGDWFLRKSPSITKRPTPEDYVSMIRGQILAATAPLQARIEGMEREFAKMEGRLEQSLQNKNAKIEVKILNSTGEPLLKISKFSTTLLSAEAYQAWEDKLREIMSEFYTSHESNYLNQYMEYSPILNFSEKQVLGESSLSKNFLNEEFDILGKDYKLSDMRSEIESIIGKSDDIYWLFSNVKLFDVKINSLASHTFTVDSNGLPRMINKDASIIQEWMGSDIKRVEILKKSIEHINKKEDFINDYIIRKCLIGIKIEINNISSNPTGRFRLEWIDGLSIYQTGRLVNTVAKLKKGSFTKKMEIYSGELLPDECVICKPLYLIIDDKENLSIRLRAIGENLGNAQKFHFVFEQAT